MFRKLTIVICLISFAPAAVNAQGLAALAASPAAAGITADSTAPSVPATNLSLPAERTKAVLLAAADSSQSTAMANAPEQKKESRSAHTWDNFVDVHFGDYRWVWWAAAAAVLIGIHVAAAD
jgi:hypothetical protein